MRQTRQAELDRLIEEVASRKRELVSIHDERHREAVRIALRLHRQAPNVPDDYTRLRMRARVLTGLRPQQPTLRDNAWTALVLLARPAPYIVRAVTIATLVVAVGLGASAASAESLPNDPLYAVKLASEDARLALAAAAGDRAAVELSIAEHRLAEAEQLATSGQTSDTLVASAMYSQHVALAAADLVAESDGSDLGTQLESRFATQRDRIATLAATLSADSRSAAAAQVLTAITQPAVAEGTTGVQRVAETAAGVAQQLVHVAEQAESRTPTVTDRETNGPTRTDAARPTTSRATDAPASTAAGHAGARPSDTPQTTTATERRASEVTKQVRKAADEARSAADKTKTRK